MMQRRRLVAILVVCSLLMPITVFLQIHSTYGRTGRIHSIEYTLDFSQRALHDIEVKMVIKGTLASSDLWLWTSSGSWFYYKDKRVFIESCMDAEGDKLTLNEVDNNTFRIRPSSNSIQLNYRVHVEETWRNIGEGYTSYVCEDFAILAEYCAFLKPSFEVEEVRVDMLAPPDWKVLTIHEMTGPTSYTADQDTMWQTYVAVGPFKVDTSTALLGNVEVTVASLGGTFRPVEEYLTYLPKLLDVYSTTVGRYPFNKLLAILAPEIMGNVGQLLSGSIMCGDQSWPTVAHELFHQWNRRVLIPEDEDSIAWFSEGFTEYYTYLGLSRTGTRNYDRFTRNLQDYRYQYERWQGTVYDLPIVKAWSVMRNTQNSSYQGIPYTKGCLIAALLDYTLRENGQSLDEFMKYLYQKYYFKNISNEIVQEALKGFTGQDYRPFIDDYIYGTARLPLQQVLTDSDVDGMANLIEKMAGTDPDNRDCDGDGLIDGGELLAGTDPLDPDTDGIGASDINKVNIVVDGYDDDWQRLRIAPKLKDKVGDSRTKMIGTDLDSVSLALDRGNLYVIAKLANGEILDNQTQYYWGSLLDVDLDNKEDFEIGFNTFGDSWLWDLAKTGGYSNRDNVRQIDDADSAHGDLVEFRFSLNEIKPIERFKLGFFIGTITNDQYVSGDFAGFSSTIQAKDTIPPRGINLTTPKIVAKEAIAQAQETIDMASCLGMEKQVTDAQDKLNEAIVAFRLADYQQAYLIAESAGKDISEGFRIEIQTKSQSISISDTTSTEILYQANWQYVTITAIVFAIFAVAVAFARHRKK